MAEFVLRDKDVFHVSLGSYEFDVENGKVDLSDVDELERSRVVADLTRLDRQLSGAVEVAENENREGDSFAEALAGGSNE